ncbi:TatD family hydrolase [Desulfopila sp. IMCC35008]|uniref:TatD family hydrolase n=1 Tax=Desulfopila sp. IMCC35008 TaxID=2653858 RepID=UPI0013D350B1|nr:TatD family hydrolase [Desulfopila sp. IMCC35008]
MGLIDTHCHIDIKRHFPDFEAVLEEACRAGVSDMVLAGVHRTGWHRLLELSIQRRYLHAAPGLHPIYMKYHHSDDLKELSRITEKGGVVAVGEIGLDYQVDVDRAIQQQLFEAQLDIASKASLPVLLHVRKAHDQALATLRRKRFSGGGIVHAFNGSLQQAEHYIGLGFMISVCGTITYERSRKIRRVASELPLSSLVLETDSPDIPPAQHYGERNSPAYLPEVLGALARLRAEDVEEVATLTTANARKILILP